MSVSSSIRALIRETGNGPVFVHTDAFTAAGLIGHPRNRLDFLMAHVALLGDAAGERPLWLPAFNYDFSRTGSFDVASDPSQVGPIPEQFRTTMADWRTPIPMFSVAGTGTAPDLQWGPGTDPFGTDSIFARLVAEDGVVLYYGDTFSYNTLMHFAERKAGGPPYRYDKSFPGRVVLKDGSSVGGWLDYHVRPLGMSLDYAWPALLDRALAAGVCKRLADHPQVLCASASALCEMWVSDVRKDPVALLDAASRAWVEPALERLGRRFLLSDFESTEPASVQPL